MKTNEEKKYTLKINTNKKENSNYNTIIWLCLNGNWVIGRSYKESDLKNKKQIKDELIRSYENQKENEFFLRLKNE